MKRGKLDKYKIPIADQNHLEKPLINMRAYLKGEDKLNDLAKFLGQQIDKLNSLKNK